MLKLLKGIIENFENEVQKLNADRRIGPLRKLKVTILGQQGLLIRQDSLIGLQLLATTDFDGLLQGEPPLEDIFKRLLREEGLTYDEQSHYIWLPEETKSEIIYDSDLIEVKSPFPIYLIVSKAAKAPEKNKQLVIDAINEFGDPLISLLEKYEVNINYFLGDLHD